LAEIIKKKNRRKKPTVRKKKTNGDPKKWGKKNGAGNSVGCKDPRTAQIKPSKKTPLTQPVTPRPK